MKKSLSESKSIRLYVLLWGLFVVGMLIAILFGETQSSWRYVGLAGFILSAGSVLLTVLMLFSIQEEIQAKYVKAVNSEKVFLTALFYFVRGFFLLLGTWILASSLSHKDVARNNLVEVSGKVSSIEVYGNDDSDLKIVFENDANEYETDTFKIPDEKFQQIQNELRPGDVVFLLIERDDEGVVNDPYVQIYAIRTEVYDYLSLDEYNMEASANNFWGLILGISFAGPGLIYLLTGRIKSKQGDVIEPDQNISTA